MTHPLPAYILPLLLLLLLLSPLLNAHMQLADPYPLRSPLNPSVRNPPMDYTSSLLPSGADFPCKGYASDPFDPVATYQVGKEYTIHLTGGEPHGGGSCQISLSYDQGEKFSVIKSIIGSCPLAGEYRFVVPTDAPAGEALLAWTWFNRLGYREMYMNCAQVIIERESETGDGENNWIWGEGSFWKRSRKHSGAARHRSRRKRDDDEEKDGDTPAVPFDKRPDIFLANIGVNSRCTTIKGREVVFPDPGPDVEYGYNVDDMAGNGYTCSESTKKGRPGGVLAEMPSDKSSYVEMASTTSFQSADSTTASEATTSTSFPTTATTTLLSTTTTTVTHTIYAPPESAPPSSSSIPAENARNEFGAPARASPSPGGTNGIPPAAGADPWQGVTIWRIPQMTPILENGMSCTPYTVKCHSKHTFSLCIEEGIFAFMGEPGPGVECKDNKIQLADI